MGLRDFLLPKNFKTEVGMGQIRADHYVKLGMERVERRSKKWLKFFMWLPVMGNFVFYREGKKEEKERGKRKGKSKRKKS